MNFTRARSVCDGTAFIRKFNIRQKIHVREKLIFKLSIHRKHKLMLYAQFFRETLDSCPICAHDELKIQK
jgi:hypothetical protein